MLHLVVEALFTLAHCDLPGSRPDSRPVPEDCGGVLSTDCICCQIEVEIDLVPFDFILPFVKEKR